MRDEFYNINEIIEGVYHISDLNKICCTLVVGKEKALLFDTGYGIGDLKQVVESITDLPIEVDIILTSHSSEQYSKELLNKLIHCVNNIDISNSEPYFNEAYPYKAFMYSEGGEPFASRDYVSIVFREDKL